MSIESIRLKFRSTNSVPVTEARISADEWAIVEDEIERLQIEKPKNWKPQEAGSMSKKITAREKAAIRLLMFIVRILSPTGYTHQIDQLARELGCDLEGEECE